MFEIPKFIKNYVLLKKYFNISLNKLKLPPVSGVQ